MSYVESQVERARARVAARAWGDARDLLRAVDESEPLDLDDLEHLALAAYLSGAYPLATETWTRAMHAAVDAGDPPRAARQAVRLGADLAFRGEFAPAMGWFGRAGSLLGGCEDCAEHAWLRTFGAVGQMLAGDPSGAAPTLSAGVTAGRGFGDRDLETMSRLGHGQCLVMQGQLADGTALLDEVMVAVTSDELYPLYAGIAYCAVIETCWRILDLRRAQQWTAALTRWCDAQPDLVPFRGNCLVHRCELLALHGQWVDAQAAANEACDQLSGPLAWASLGGAYYQLAELQRMRGEFAPAENSYRRAADAGARTEPGLALLRLAQGRADAAAAVMRRVLAETDDPPGRSRLLPAHAEIMVATGDIAAARHAADELAGIAEVLDAPYLHAHAAATAGAVLLAEGEPGAALGRLRAAAAAWHELDAPREIACARTLIGLACRALGDLESADIELAGARRVFDQLGARPDVARLDRLAASGPTADGGLTTREVEVLRLVAAGRTNRAIATTLAISEKTVARHLSNIFAKIDVPSRAAATAYAYEHRVV